MKKEFLYGFLGLVVGVVIALFFTVIFAPKNDKVVSQSQKAEDHMMPDGTMMSNSHNEDSMTMDSMVNVLVGKSGDKFDKAFLEGMIEHHVGAVDMAKLASKNAKHQELKDMAKNIIDAQEVEIETMKDWQKDWGYTK